MAKKLDFKDFLSVDYAPGEPDQIKKNAKKRKQDIPTGSNAEYSSIHEPRKEEKEMCPECDGTGEVDGEKCDHCNGTGYHMHEALNVQQRRARSRQMKKYKARLAVGRKKAAAKLANSGTLKKRARKAARAAIAKKLTKGIPKSELTFARKQEIEKRLDKLGSRISKLAAKMLPKLRKAEMERKRSKK